MKTEILATIVVLAGVLAATQWESAPWFNATAAANSTHLSAAPNSGSTFTNQPGNFESEEINSVERHPIPIPEGKEDQNYLIEQAARTLAYSPPLQAKLRYKIDLFGQLISGPGRYYQKGNGTRLTRMEFDFGFNDNSVQIHQFCDGDMLYTLSIAGDKSNLEFVDLRKLDKLQNSVESSSRVANWLSVGSLTGLMEQLATHFEFKEAYATKLGQIPVIELTGNWRASSLERLLEGQLFDETAKDGIVRWQQLPDHMPHQVRLVLGADDRFPYFPYRIIFEKFEFEGEQRTVKKVAVLELFELKESTDLPDEMFRLPSIETKPSDSTEFYKQRIQQFTR